MSSKINVSRIIGFVIALVISFAAVFPFLLLINVSLKTRSGFLQNPLGLTETFELQNYITTFQRANIPRGLFNSVLITSLSVIAVIFFGSLAAYALCKMRFKRSRFFSVAFLAPMIFPIQTVFVPLYLMFRKLNLINNFPGVIIIYTATGLPFVIFMLNSFMKTIPYQISEAALIEGASHMTVYSRLIMPLLGPVISTIIIVSGLGIWNDFFLPLVMLNSMDMKTLPLSIYTFTGQYNNNWPLICTCVVFVIVPVIIIYLFLQKNIISGVVAGSIKG